MNSKLVPFKRQAIIDNDGIFICYTPKKFKKVKKKIKPIPLKYEFNRPNKTAN